MCAALTFFRISAKIGTMEFTGFEMMRYRAEGHADAQALAIPATAPAFLLKRSSRVILGCRGTPRIKTRVSISSGGKRFRRK